MTVPPSMPESTPLLIQVALVLAIIFVALYALSGFFELVAMVLDWFDNRRRIKDGAAAFDALSDDAANGLHNVGAKGYLDQGPYAIVRTVDTAAIYYTVLYGDRHCCVRQVKTVRITPDQERDVLVEIGIRNGGPLAYVSPNYTEAAYKPHLLPLKSRTLGKPMVEALYVAADEATAKWRQEAAQEYALALEARQKEQARQAELDRQEQERLAIERREAMIAAEEWLHDNAKIEGVTTRWQLGTPDHRSVIRDSLGTVLRGHDDGTYPIDFDRLGPEGRAVLLPAFLGIKVGGAIPRYDFGRSDPTHHRFVYVTHRGPADVAEWRTSLPLINRYLGGSWQIEPLDGTSLTVVRRPELPSVVRFSPNLLRKGQVLFGFNMATAQPYYVPLDKLTHVLVGGQSGVGKSVLLNQCMRSLLHNLDLIDELILVDLKGGVELSRYKGLSPKIRFIKRYEDLPDVVEQLVATMYRRLDELEKRGELAVTSGYRIVIIDEFAAIQQRTPKRDEKERHQTLLANLNLLSQQARAAGIKLWAQLQKPTADNMDTSFRTNLQSVLCFYMPSKVNATSMFGELEGLPADPTQLGKGEFVFRDDGQNQTVLLKSTFCDEHDRDGLVACLASNPDDDLPEAA